MSAFSSLSEFWQTMLPFIMLVEIVLEIGLFFDSFFCLFYVTAFNATINKKSALSVGICRGTIITKTHLFSYVCKKL